LAAAKQQKRERLPRQRKQSRMFGVIVEIPYIAMALFVIHEGVILKLEKLAHAIHTTICLAASRARDWARNVGNPLRWLCVFDGNADGIATHFCQLHCNKQTGKIIIF